MPGLSAEWAIPIAEKACIEYIAKLNKMTISDAQGGAYYGDIIEGFESDIFVFQLSGGPAQEQNYQCRRPDGHGPQQWLMDAQLLAQFTTSPGKKGHGRDKAQKFVGKVMEGLPVYKNPKNTNNRGLRPNVNLFEMTFAPRFPSREVPVNPEEPDGEIQIFYMAEMDFRVEFGNEKN
ncbi:MAG: hypothetical protein KAS32_24675 [Candidatus Peribacteraceae bacterium]|nr:hypothetical protein [Candidatus Peribacteraceae bacterium]